MQAPEVQRALERSPAVVLDEVQRLPTLFEPLRGLIDPAQQ